MQEGDKSAGEEMRVQGRGGEYRGDAAHGKDIQRIFRAAHIHTKTHTNTYTHVHTHTNTHTPRERKVRHPRHTERGGGGDTPPPSHTERGGVGRYTTPTTHKQIKIPDITAANLVTSELTCWVC